jgi:hypothetical protein
VCCSPVKIFCSVDEQKRGEDIREKHVNDFVMTRVIVFFLLVLESGDYNINQKKRETVDRLMQGTMRRKKACGVTGS